MLNTIDSPKSIYPIDYLVDIKHISSIDSMSPIDYLFSIYSIYFIYITPPSTPTSPDKIISFHPIFPIASPTNSCIIIIVIESEPLDMASLLGVNA